MHRNVILLVDADVDTENSVHEAAVLSQLGVRYLRTSNDAFAVMQTELEDVAVIIVDLDAAVDGITALQALDASNLAPSVIFVASIEHLRLRAIALAHGAKACLEKPLDVVRLKDAIEIEAVKARHICSDRCDLSDDPCRNCARQRTIAGKGEPAFS